MHMRSKPSCMVSTQRFTSLRECLQKVRLRFPAGAEKWASYCTKPMHTARTRKRHPPAGPCGISCMVPQEWRNTQGWSKKNTNSSRRYSARLRLDHLRRNERSAERMKTFRRPKLSLYSENSTLHLFNKERINWIPHWSPEISPSACGVSERVLCIYMYMSVHKVTFSKGFFSELRREFSFILSLLDSKLSELP